MKKILSCLLAVILLTLSLSACAKPSVQTNGDKISIVATIFPQYDWVRQILGEKLDQAELTLLLNNGVDLHSYQPTVEDIAAIANCDMFIYVGGESDAWVESALESTPKGGRVVINLLEVLGDSVKEEEIVEGMEHDHEHGHGEISPEDVHDRPLSDWLGSWTSVEPALAGGALDEYITHLSEENETEFEQQKAAYEERWKSDFEAFSISESSVSFDGVSSPYQYIGFRLVESDHGASVWYGFEAEGSDEKIPRYIAFSDHGTGGQEEEGHEEEHTELPHFHFRYGNESFEALTAIENWSPTYFPSDASQEEIAEAMRGHSHEHELDEHVWLSLKNARNICTYISKELGKLDPDNASVYTENTEKYNNQLSLLDTEYENAIKASPVQTLLFGDRFPFRYLTDDYSLDYYAAFSGCSAETEASFETIVFLSDKADELRLKNIMVIESSDQSVANTIIQNSSGKDQKILVLDSMQSIDSANLASGVTYLSIMENNLATLKEALS